MPEHLPTCPGDLLAEGPGVAPFVKSGVRNTDRKSDVQDISEMLPVTYVEEVECLFRDRPTAADVTGPPLHQYRYHLSLVYLQPGHKGDPRPLFPHCFVFF